MNIRSVSHIGTVSALLIFCGAADAALFDRGGGLVYDNVLNITWLQNANLPFTLTPDTPGDCFSEDGGGEICFPPTPAVPQDGAMTYADANTFVSNLEYDDVVRGVTWDDWRLPTVGPINGTNFQTNTTYNGTSDEGYARTTTNGLDGGWRQGDGTPVSELGYNFYVNLMNLGGCTATDAAPATCIRQTDRVLGTGPFINLPTDPFFAYWANSASTGDSTGAWVFDPYSGFQAHTDNVSREWLVWAVRDGDVAPVPLPAAVWMFGSAIGLLGWAKRKRI